MNAKLESKALTRIMLCSAVICALLLSLVHLTGDLYGDEGHTYRVVSGDFWDYEWSPYMGHPPLYFALAKAGYWASGGRPWGIRLPSLVFSLGAVVLLPLVARRLLGQRQSLLVAWLAATSPALLEFSAEGRPYAMLMFFGAAFIGALHAFLQRESKSTALVLAATAAGGMLTYYLFVFLVVAGVIYYLIFRRRVTHYALLAGGLVCLTAVLMLPLVFRHFWGQSVHFRQQGTYPIWTMLLRVPVALSFGYAAIEPSEMDLARNVRLGMLKQNWHVLVLAGLAMLSIVYALIVLIRRKQPWVWFLIVATAVPMALGIVARLGGVAILREKYFFAIWGPFLLLISLALAHLATRKWGCACIAAYVALVVLSLVHFTGYADVYSRRTNTSGLVAHINARATGCDVVLQFRIPPEPSHDRFSGLRRDLRRIGIESSRPAEVSLEAYLTDLSSSVAGRIYLISEELARNLVDPDLVIKKKLLEIRDVESIPFGRNLILYVAAPKNPSSVMPTSPLTRPAGG